jgi:hypothetical protein
MTTVHDNLAVDQQGGAAMPKDKRACELMRQLARVITDGSRRGLPIGFVDTFLMIAADEGRSVNDYAEMAGVSKSVMSRQILDIGDATRDHEPGLQWVTTRLCPNEPGRHEVFLTAKGCSLERRLTELLDLWASTRSLAIHSNREE